MHSNENSIPSHGIDSDLNIQALQRQMTGMVYKKVLGTYYVQANGHIVTCEISTRLRRVLLYPTADPNSIRPHVVSVREINQVDPVAVGDQVRFVEAGGNRGLIVEVLPRRSRLSRPAQDSSRRTPANGWQEQVIVANVDLVLAVIAAAQPEPKWNLLDRYLVSAESLGLPVAICLTKHDLLESEHNGRQEALMQDLTVYRQIGYPVLLISAVTGRGLDALQDLLRGKLTVLIGKSGVGKTTLLNALQPDLGLRVNEVNQKSGKGRHTTTHLELFPLDSGGSLIDTPGMREFGLWQIDANDLAAYFPEMHEFLGRCRFGVDCSHVHEPGCAVRSACEDGEIASWRYQSFLKLREE
jgi:ribosome biogenesis GTPase